MKQLLILDHNDNKVIFVISLHYRTANLCIIYRVGQKSKPQIFAHIVWCGMSFLPFLLPKLILLAFWLSWGSNKPEILGFNFSRRSTPFYVTIFKMASSKLNMPHIDPSKLHTITSFVSEPKFLIMRRGTALF